MSNKSRAIILMLLTALSFAIMAVMVKMAGSIPTMEKMVFRNVISVIIAFITIRKTGDRLFGKKENQRWLFARAFFGTAGMFLSFYAISHLYLADASMLNNLAPFVVTILASIFLKEKLSKIQVPALIIVFIASLLVIKPSFDLRVLPALIGLMSAIASGTAYTIVRFLNDKENPYTIVFYFSVVSTLLVVPFAPFYFVVPTREQLVYLVLAGVFATLGQYGLSFAYRLANASEIVVYNYTNIIFSALLGLWVWNEIPDALSITGGSIIILVSAGLFLYAGRGNRQ
ncbi:MAG: DMT family transporter [Bacteroidia bacterium]|nr:DMT family transporter [Bacteroidia bacterium]